MHKFIRSQFSRPDNQSSGYIFSGLLGMLILLIAGFVFLNSPFFNVGNIVVEGNKYLSAEEVCRVAEIPQAINILKLDTGDIRQRLKRDLRVSDVEVIRKFPGTIVISVTERKPLAYLASGYGFVEIDKNGVILAAYRNLKQINVPIITGFRLDNGYVGDTVDNNEANILLTYLVHLDEQILNQLSEVNVTQSGVITAYTVSSSQIRIGKADRLTDKAKLTNEVLRELGDKTPSVEYIDLNYASPFIKFRQ